MKSTGKLLARSSARKSAVVVQVVSALISLILIFVVLDKLMEYKDRNYYGRYDEEISRYTFYLIGLGCILLSEVATLCAVATQKIMVYEKVVYGVARKTMFTNRIVEIPYEDVRGVDFTSKLVKIYTRTDEIHFLVDESGYVASLIRKQWNSFDEEGKHHGENKECIEPVGEESEMPPRRGTEDVESHVAYFHNFCGENIVCPHCGTKQDIENDCCVKCGIEFIFCYDT